MKGDRVFRCGRAEQQQAPGQSREATWIPCERRSARTTKDAVELFV